MFLSFNFVYDNKINFMPQYCCGHTEAYLKLWNTWSTEICCRISLYYSESQVSTEWWVSSCCKADRCLTSAKTLLLLSQCLWVQVYDRFLSRIMIALVFCLSSCSFWTCVFPVSLVRDVETRHLASASVMQQSSLSFRPACLDMFSPV